MTHFEAKHISNLVPGDMFYWNTYVASQNIARCLTVAIYCDAKKETIYVGAVLFGKYVTYNHTKALYVYVLKILSLETGT